MKTEQEPLGEVELDRYPVGMASPQPKRQVSYNQAAYLCPACNKRVRLNNNGAMRIHLSAKMGSSKCILSNVDPFHIPSLIFDKPNNKADTDSEQITEEFFQKEEQLPLFSDLY